MTTLTSFLLIFSCHDPLMTKNISSEIKEENVCFKNSDCHLVNEGCCDCNHGGTRKGSLKKNKKSLENRHNTMCMTMISTHKTCSKQAQAICIKGACKIK